jgi:hypothetical protein
MYLLFKHDPTFYFVDVHIVQACLFVFYIFVTINICTILLIENILGLCYSDFLSFLQGKYFITVFIA